MVRLKGLAWDHRRCWGPLEASVPQFRELHPDVDIQWDRRSLWEFGEGRFDHLVDRYDLIVFDHPFVGEIAESGLFLDLGQVLDRTQLASFEKDALGPSWRSYHYEGIWGLPIDAAAQVSSYRPDLMQALDRAPPRTLAEVLSLGEATRRQDKWIAWPSVPTDVMCTCLSFAAGLGFAIGEDAPFLSEEQLAEIFAGLRLLRLLSHPESARWNPIACYDHMTTFDDVVYCPFGFGYVNYSVPDAVRPLAFADGPALGQGKPSGALLGGAGLGISSRTRHPELALEYALLLADPAYQASAYVATGGQPASLTAWVDASMDMQVNGFFSSTLRTLQHAYLRPTFPGFVEFFRRAAIGATRVLSDELPVADLAAELNAHYEEIRNSHASKSAV